MEARAYAARNRAGSDWFGHNDENNSPAEEARQMPVQPIQEEGICCNPFFFCDIVNYINSLYY